MYYPLIMSMNKQIPLLLDLFPNASVGYSLRKLRIGATNSIRVRRNVDNAEQDIGFSGNNLDTNSMLNFVGANLWTFSEEWDNAVYTKTGLNTSGTPNYINVEIAPDTTLTADKIIESNISQGHLSSRQFLVTNGETYNVSVYLKYGGRNAQISSAISSLATYQVDVDLINGTLSNNTFPTTPTLTNVGNNWYRLSYSVTATITQTRTALAITLQNLSAPNPINYLGDGVSGVFVWGFQLSQTSSVRLYQKTVASAGGNGFISKWYDQSINNNHAEQPTLLGSQAQIVSNGNLILDADTGKITSTWTLDRYNLTSGISTNTQYLSISMWRRGSTATDSLTHLGNAIGNTPTPLWWAGSGTSFSVRSYMSTIFSYGIVSTIGRCIITSLRNSSNLKVAYRNGVQLSLTSVQAPQVGTLTTFGQLSTSLYTSGQYQEYIYWDSDQSANRVAIETNINNYWNAY